MPAKQLAFIAALVLSAVAQTPPGFKPSTNASLMVTFGNTPVQPAGVLLPQPVTMSQPAIGLPGASKGKYMAVMIDIDVFSNGVNTNLVHWIQGGFTAAAGSSELFSSGSPLAPYLPPNPPAGQNHRYVEVLFNQPQDFTIPASFAAIFANLTASVANRKGFNLDKFIGDSKLGDPVAGNFFHVEKLNTTASATPTNASVPSRTVAAPTEATTTPGSAPTRGNGGVAGHVLNISTLLALGILGIAINMF